MNPFYKLLYKYLPWRSLMRKAALAHGFIDPVALMSHLHRFAQPSEVNEPIELLRAGAMFHARGLINTRTIQHNLDWVWPYWVVKQFDPRSSSFIPRAFSMTHINLTHRNWTAVGMPWSKEWPIVDPAGLCTPIWDGWSIDFWVIGENGEEIIPSRFGSVNQKLYYGENLLVSTKVEDKNLKLKSEVFVSDDNSLCDVNVYAESDVPAGLVVSLRPYNPEGVSFIHHLEYEKVKNSFVVDNSHTVSFNETPSAVYLSDYKKGDVYSDVSSYFTSKDSVKDEIICDVGMATSAAVFPISSSKPCSLSLSVKNKTKTDYDEKRDSIEFWSNLSGYCELKISDVKIQELYDIALRTVILFTPDDPVPGPYTYKRFWFRDAAFILHSLLCLGFTDMVRKALERFPSRQNFMGYFKSQEGEWDSNGQVLWIFQRFKELSNQNLPDNCVNSVRNAADWICKKRLSKDLDAPHAGLLPAGFSAEHLGPNDYYYWDDFWSVSGLRAASGLLSDDSSLSKYYSKESDSLKKSIEKSFSFTKSRIKNRAMPASPYRRMDSGAIGSIVSGYPLDIYNGNDPRLSETVEYILDNCFLDNAFYQDMIHSGINPYLTLHVAQVLLRAGDIRFKDLILSVANLATQTGQWPEAIHPITRGGCMGDGQHGWAAAEWLMMIKNCFVREEPDKLVLASGVLDSWISPESEASFGPALTKWGKVKVKVEKIESEIKVSWDSEWYGNTPEIEVAFPGKESIMVSDEDGMVVV